MEKTLVLPNHEKLRNLLSGSDNSTAGISDIEIQHLCYLGANLPPGGDVVEIGSHRGKSICCIGSGVLSARNAKARIFCIDLWTRGTKTFDHYHSGETYEIFQRQVADCGLTDRVRAIMTSSLDAAKRRSKPIHLLFIDASHKYKDVLADYQAWHGFVAPGGVIAFHDYGGRFTGVTKTIDETVIPSGLWTDIQRYGRIWSAVRK